MKKTEKKTPLAAAKKRIAELEGKVKCLEWQIKNDYELRPTQNNGLRLGLEHTWQGLCDRLNVAHDEWKRRAEFAETVVAAWALNVKKQNNL